MDSAVKPACFHHVLPHRRKTKIAGRHALLDGGAQVASRYGLCFPAGSISPATGARSVGSRDEKVLWEALCVSVKCDDDRGCAVTYEGMAGAALFEAIVAGRQTCETQARVVRGGCVALQGEAKLCVIGPPLDRCAAMKADAGDFHVEAMLVQPAVEPAPNAVFRKDEQPIAGLLKITAEAESSEDGIVGDDGRGGAEGAAEAEVGLAGVVPGAAMMRLAEPGHAVRGWFESAAGAAVVRESGIPVPIAGLRCTAVYERPGAEVGGVAEAEVLVGIGGIVQGIVHDRPSAHL